MWQIQFNVFLEAGGVGMLIASTTEYYSDSHPKRRINLYPGIRFLEHVNRLSIRNSNYSSLVVKDVLYIH